MVDIRYKGNHELADLAGKSLADVRKEYAATFRIPDKAAARLNGMRIKPGLESETKLSDCDEVSFAAAKSGKGAFLLGALLLALTINGGVFASGYLTNTATLNVHSAGGDFARITAASGQPTWTVFGATKGAIGSGNLFVVDTLATNYPGDLAVTVYLSNIDQLIKAYKALNLRLYAVSSNGTAVDINSDGVLNTDDTVLLTMDNGQASLYIDQLTGSDNYTIRVKNGYYISNHYGQGWPSGAHEPSMYAQVAQR